MNDRELLKAILSRIGKSSLINNKQYFRFKDAKLILLSLESFEINELPDGISEFISLKGLNLQHNYLKELPDQLKSLINLEILVLGYNKFSDLPNVIEFLHSLKRLYLHRNKINELPNWIGNLKHLKELKIPWNSLSQFPKTLRDLDLNLLTFQENNFSIFPEVVYDLLNLELLILYDNPIENISDKILNLNKLERLGISQDLFDNNSRNLIKKLEDKGVIVH